MISRSSLLVADRVFRELRRDIRTMILFIVSPAFVMVLTAGILQNYPRTFDRVGLIVLGLFPTAPTFLFTAFAVLRDRNRGTLEHLLTAPVKKLDVLVGYLLAFTLPAIVQICLTLSVTYGFLNLKTAAGVWQVGLLAVMNSVLGVAIGLFVTNLAHNEFQLTKILAAIAAPHLMLSGLFRPHQNMVGWMRDLSNIAPWRYGVAAVAELQKNASPTSTMWFNVLMMTGIILLLFSVSTATVLKRRTA